MTSALSKRQQARNEKALQDLVHNVPGNNACADCQARNPAWASWSLGVFLCMRCASIHRKLGTHISKVKSLSMDGWSNEQVENMKKVGNVTSNKIYNPENKKPPVPIDADEADSAMERFIRSKYVTNSNQTSRQRSLKALDEGTPPPLPPKTGSKFSFRSASSILPLTSRSKKESRIQAPLPSPHEFPRSPSPVSYADLKNKPSRVFGASVQHDPGDDTETKLVSLRDMGFTDTQRNITILKGVNGNLERAIETLVRLGEGDRRSPAPATTTGPRLRPSRSMTPMTTPNSAPIPQNATFPDRPHTPLTASSNPFDLLPAQPQTAQSTGTLQNRNPFFQTSTNPFGQPLQQQDINQAFGNLSLAPPQTQPLFPHHTGGLPGPQQQVAGMQQQQQQQAQQPQPQPQQQQFYAQVPATQGYAPMNFSSNMTYPQPMPPQATGNNPFLTVQTQPAIIQQNLSPNSATASPGSLNSNPFARSPTRIQSPSLGQIPEQSQYSFSTSPQPLSPSAGNPFFAQYQQQAPQAQQMQAQQMQAQQMQAQAHLYQSPQLNSPLQQNNPFAAAQPAMQAQQYQVQRPDTASIMALYGQQQQMLQSNPGQVGQAQLQAQAQAQAQAQSQATSPAVENSFFQTAAPVQPIQQRSASLPLPAIASKNPFLMNGGPTASVASAVSPTGVTVSTLGMGATGIAPQQQKPNVSRESMAFTDMNWANGRHSPDAFASLSSRHM